MKPEEKFWPPRPERRDDVEYTEWLKRANFVASLYFLDVIQFGEFKLKAHRDPRWQDMDLSPFFINLRKKEHGGPLKPEAARWIGQQVGHGYRYCDGFGHHTHIGYDIGFITGIPRAGVDLARGFHDVWDRSKALFLEMEKSEDKKEAGIQLLTDVSGLQSRRGIVVDEVITNAVSKIEVRDELAKHGLEVAAFAIVLDREAGGAEEMARLNIPLYAHLGLAETLGTCKNLGFITEETLDKCLGYGEYMEAYQQAHP